MKSQDFEDQSTDRQNLFEQPITEKFADVFAAPRQDCYANEGVSTEGIEREPEVVAEMNSTISYVPGDASVVSETGEDQTKTAFATFAGVTLQAQDTG